MDGQNVAFVKFKLLTSYVL